MSEQTALIGRGARWTRWAVTALLVATLIFQILSLFPATTHVQIHRVNSGPLGQGVNLAHSAFIILALVQLILLLRDLERGHLFSSIVTRRLRGFALFTLLAVAVGAFVAPLLNFVYANCPAGTPCPRRFPIDMRGVWSLVTSIVFFLVARVLDEARRIDEDNRQII